MGYVYLNKLAEKQFKELKKRIARELGLNELEVSASIVIHELYKLYMKERH